jgi:uncharacterized RDD family membrane protein YckC
MNARTEPGTVGPTMRSWHLRGVLALTALYVISVVLVAAYWVVVPARFGGQTLGMRPWRIKVVDAQGGPAAAGRLWLRFGVACLTPAIGLLWCLLDRERRGLHDLAAGTLVVRLDKAVRSEK